MLEDDCIINFVAILVPFDSWMDLPAGKLDGAHTSYFVGLSISAIVPTVNNIFSWLLS